MSHATGHPTFLKHHFSDAQQQRESAKLGMWIFLLTEILLFGGLFTAYSIYRAWNPDMFHNAHQFLDLHLGAINTVVLITSSLTMALAIRSMQLGNKKSTITNLILTLLLASVFLVTKYFEYSHKIHLGQLPGKFYTFTGIEGNNPHVFFSVYFLMTGLHGIHVAAGMAVISGILYKTIRNTYSPQYYTPIEMTGLYWHLVDMIWIFLFPLFPAPRLGPPPVFCRSHFPHHISGADGALYCRCRPACLARQLLQTQAVDALGLAGVDVCFSHRGCYLPHVVQAVSQLSRAGIGRETQASELCTIEFSRPAPPRHVRLKRIHRFQFRLILRRSETILPTRMRPA